MANKNPSPETRFGGPRANPNGKTAVQKRQEMVNAEKAVELRGKMLDALAARFADMDSDELVEQMDQHFLKMLKDAEDRGLGAPTQAHEHSSPDGSMSPNKVELVAKQAKNDDGSD